MSREILHATENTETLTCILEDPCAKKEMRKPFSLDLEEKEESKDIPPPPHACVPHVSSVQPFSHRTEPSSSVSQVTPLPPDVEALFIEMASRMILLKTPLLSTTEIYLNSPQFAHSQFYGTKITITEFSTAPKAFNVELASTPNATISLELHKATLMEAFGRGHFNFSVENLTVCLSQDEDSVFSRKKPVSQDEEESLS